MARQVRLAGTNVDYWLETGEGIESLVEVIENIIEDMKASPGDANEEITLVIVNDFEPEEESEDEESEDIDGSNTDKKEA